MNKKLPTLLLGLAGPIAFVIAGTVLYLNGHAALLTPKGVIASQERTLMLVAVLLMFIVVIPVFVFTTFIVWKYRAGNPKAKYTPDWDGSRKLELTWWGIPIAIIAVLAVITWVSSHTLDPFRPLDSAKPPLTIQVVALQWKWLFIYPNQHIGTVNYLELPTGRPVNFEITADAPMNSFWIPQLGGQIYAMPGMVTQLNLQADQPGSYNGYSANISGQGFANMHFVAKAVSQSDFDRWAAQAKQGPNILTATAYDQLAKPSSSIPTTDYASVDPDLYDTIINKFMLPSNQQTSEAVTP